MSAAFPRSLQAIRTDDTRRPIAGIAIAVALLGAWLAWLFLARVTRCEVSGAARLEVDQTAYRVEAPVEGKIVAVRYALGAEVDVGDVLLELDDEPLRLKLNEERARLAAVEAQIEPLRREMTVRDGAQREPRAAGRSQVSLTAARAGAEAQGRERGYEAELARRERQAIALDGEKRTLQATIDALLGAIDRQKIRAPVSGRIGEATVLRAGAFVKAKDAIAVIVPRGDLRIAADFPLTSIGRLHAGQPARLRLDAFPWTEYGAVRATVESVGTEAHQGHVRVELGVLPDASSPIPIQHGLTGTVVVEVERVSPATLVLRSAGQLLRTRDETGR